MNPITSNRRPGDLSPLELSGTLDEPNSSSNSALPSPQPEAPFTSMPVVEPLANPELLLPTRGERRGQSDKRSAMSWALPLFILVALAVIAFVAMRPHSANPGTGTGTGTGTGMGVDGTRNTAPADKTR